MIQARHLTKRYGSTVAVRDISFSVDRGEVLGFLGPNGAGKTTTMRILTGFIPPDQGSAAVAGFDISTQSLEVRGRVGYLPESAPLYTDMGVVEFLEYIAALRKIPGSKIAERVRAMIEVCGLDRVVKKDIGELSKGYRQRVGLAQAMIHDPDLLILDEPTSGLDPNQIIEIRELIKQLGQEKTVVLSTHILTEVQATCSRVLIINEGALVADGTPDELAARARTGQVLYTTIQGAGTDLRESLDRLPGLVSYREMETPAEGGARYLLEAGAEVPLAVELFKLAVERSWVLTEIRPEVASLEDVFLQLTNDGRTA